jgi:hypothetical protein
MLVTDDFIKIVEDSPYERINLESINTAYITLILENSDPQYMNDYRPIPCVSHPLKICMKLLANRLQKDIIPILHQNQYGFIKGINIHDCLGWTFDFEKALDEVEYNDIIAMLEAQGLMTHKCRGSTVVPVNMKGSSNPRGVE